MKMNQVEHQVQQWKKRRKEILDFLLQNKYIQQTEKQEKHQKKFFPLKADCLKNLKVAGIMDSFTKESYDPECRLLELTPANWKAELDAFEPDLLFIESAWQGKGGLWFHKIDRYSAELEELTAYLREKKVPIVFWNKEDPVYTDAFMIAASYADVVFTTDIDCIARYKAELEHDRVYHLHFAAQPGLHNPIEKFERKDKFCFAGAYYHKYKDRAQIFDQFSEHFIQGKGLDIYDRNYKNARPEHAFPSRYTPYILGSLPSDQIDRAYKGYYYGVNMNSISQSQSMFARRVFEVLASNTIAVGNFSRGVKNYFGDLTVCTDDPKTLMSYLDRYCSDRQILEKYRLLGLRKVLSQHLYEDRLGYITEKVFGRNLTRALPSVTVLSRVNSAREAQRVERMFQSQTLQGCKLVLIGEVTQEQQKRYTCFSCSQAKTKKVADIAQNGFVAWFDSSDWYGPNYLTDLMLTLRYGDYNGVGKVAHFKSDELSSVAWYEQTAAYRPAESLRLRCAAFAASCFEQSPLDQLDGSQVLNDQRLMGVDPFNYCENWVQETCPMAQDFVIADQGISQAEINACAERICPLEEPDEVLRFKGSDFARIVISNKTPARITASKTQCQIECELPDEKHAYLFLQDTRLEVDPWLIEGKLPIQFRGAGGLDLICVVLCFDREGKKLSPLFPKLNRYEMLSLPKGTQTVELGFRLKGSGSAIIKDVLIGSAKATIEQTGYLSRSHVLVLTNHYPSPQALYRNMFVHKRMTAYRESGEIFDVLRMDPYSKDGFREFEGINVTEGKGATLLSILDSGTIDTVCVHFLNREMWEVLKPYAKKKVIRLLIWSHGADIQPWWRRTFNHSSEQVLDEAKKQSEETMALWNEVFQTTEQNPNIHFVYVSQYFANEIMEDYKIALRPNQYSIIHNFIDTEVFCYAPKPEEQRKKIMTVKPFASAKYANDLTTKGILELSKRPCFADLEIDIYGSGELFETDNAPLKRFSNVHLHRQFLTHTEISQLHKSHGVFIATTRWDSQGVSRDEAMSSGLVPIAHNCSAIPEFVDDSCGILIPPESYLELADAIERLYQEEELFLRLSEGAAKRVRGQTSLEYTIEKELSLICGF